MLGMGLEAKQNQENLIMETFVPQPPRCRTCSAILQTPGEICTACQTIQHITSQQLVQQFVPLKSKGIAVLLTFFWLGAGHLYADRIGTGIVLILIDMFLVFLAMTGVGLIIAFPVWLILFMLAALLSVSAVDQCNAAAAMPRAR